MLIATITTLILVFGLGAAEAFDSMLTATGERVGEHVTDPERTAAAQVEVEVMRVELRRFLEETQACQELLVTIDTDYDATREDYQIAIDRIDGNWRRFEEAMLDYRFALQGQIRGEEWPLVFPPQLSERGPGGGSAE